MKYIFLIILNLFIALNFYCQDTESKIKDIINYLNRNNLTIYKDGSILTNQRIILTYINDLVKNIGRSNSITFTVRTKNGGLYNVTFQIKNDINNKDNKTLGNIVSIREFSNEIKTNLYPMESLDVLTLLYRYREKEELSLNDNIYLLNSMIYKDETLQSMINNKLKETQSNENIKEINSLRAEQKKNKMDIINISNKIISIYENEINLIQSKGKLTKEESDIVIENQNYIKNYKELINYINSKE